MLDHLVHKIVLKNSHSILNYVNVYIISLTHIDIVTSSSFPKYWYYIRIAMENKNKEVSGRSRPHHHAYKRYWIIV